MSSQAHTLGSLRNVSHLPQPWWARGSYIITERDKDIVIRRCFSTNLCCFCSVTKRCLTLCSPIDCSMPGFPVLLCLLELSQTHIHWLDDAIQPSHPLCPLLLLLLQSFPASRSFPMSQLFASGGPSIGASVSVLPVNIHGWFPLESTDLIFLLSKRQNLIQHHSLKASVLRCSVFFMVQLTSIHDNWKNHRLDYMDCCWQILCLGLS